jgi:mono/diheme cytochrome c family protein
MAPRTCACAIVFSGHCSFEITMKSLFHAAFIAMALSAPSAYAADETPYKVVDGYKVDPVTMTGFRTWRQAACDRCHGANQEGLVGPSLVTSLKTLTKQEFVTTVTNGRLEKGMQSFGTSKQVMDNIDALYQYLKGRSDGAITRSKVEPLPQ